MVGKAGERCHGGEGLPDTLEMWKARALAFRETLDTLKAQRDEARVERDVARNDTEAALVTVGAFRQAIEDVFAVSEGQSAEDGFIVSYVIPVDVLMRAIGLARGTDAGGALLAQLAASEQRAAALVEADNVLAEYVGHQPFSLAKLTAIEAWRAALAAAAPSAATEGT